MQTLLIMWLRYEKMIRMIAQDFAGTARIQGISVSFRSISDEFCMSDCQPSRFVDLLQSASRNRDRRCIATVFLAIRQRWKAKRNQKECCRFCFQRMSQFQRHSKMGNGSLA